MRLKKLAPVFLVLSATLFGARFGIDNAGRIVRLTDPQISRVMAERASGAQHEHQTGTPAGRQRRLDARHGHAEY
jgi:hypothetical protein